MRNYYYCPHCEQNPSGAPQLEEGKCAHCGREIEDLDAAERLAGRDQSPMSEGGIVSWLGAPSDANPPNSPGGGSISDSAVNNRHVKQPETQKDKTIKVEESPSQVLENEGPESTLRTEPPRRGKHGSPFRKPAWMLTPEEKEAHTEHQASPNAFQTQKEDSDTREHQSPMNALQTQTKTRTHENKQI